jgi:hypothetical protein
MATTTILNDLIDLNQTGNTTALKGCVGTNAQQPATPTISVQYLVVGGGGGGGSNGTASGDGLGGGGAGGLSTGTIAVPNNTAVNIVIGQGGLGGGQTSDESGTNGQDSGFYQIQGQGGGGGGEGSAAGFPGGSGGGGGRNSGQYTNTGTGVSGQGNNGGIGGYTGGSYQASSGGGGGGKGSVGAGGGNDQSSGGAGGSGYDAVPSGIITQTNANTAGVGETNGAERNFAGGGGGGQANAGTVLGGSGGGGNGGANSVGSPGTANTGGGGGGDGSTTQGGGGTGGSGVVILKYANTATETIAGSLAGGITTGTTSVLDYPSGTSCVALYEFESNGDSTSSASNNQTTVGTLTYSTGNFNNAVSGFSGSNYFQTAGLFDTMFGTNAAREISFSVWIKTSSSNYQGICGAYVYSAGAGMNLAVDSTGKIRQQISAGSTSGNSGGAAGGNGGPYVDTQATVNDGNWHHVVVTYKSDGTTSGSNRGILNQYIDGVNVTSSSTFLQSGSSWTNGTANPWSSTSSAFFTGTYDGSSYHFEGEIDQLRLYTTQLTDSQVAMLYAENIGATKFTESSDTVLVFKGGSGTINLTDTSLPGPKVGDLRTNTDQTSNTSASAMEHYMSTGWRVLTNVLPPSISYLVIAGGGAGGKDYSGGGGAGGYRTNYGGTPFGIIIGNAMTVTVGAGGTTASLASRNGEDSTFASITSSGGGGGGDVITGSNNCPTGYAGLSGGSGGGSGYYCSPPTGGSGNIGSYTPVEGYAGGGGNDYTPGVNGGGGGGASGVGGNQNTGYGQGPGTGGAGLFSDITGVNIQRGGGGTGCGLWYGAADFVGGAGGGGGGASYYYNNTGTAGVNGTGGGGGGGWSASRGMDFPGGSGIVILRYNPSLTLSIDTGNLVTSTLNGIVTGGTDKYTEFTGGTGTIKIN